MQLWMLKQVKILDCNLGNGCNYSYRVSGNSYASSTTGTLKEIVKLTSCIQVGMHKATYELLGDGTFYAEIPGLQGVWGNAPTLEACREDLQDALEEWILLGLQLGHTLPMVDEWARLQ